MVLSKDNTQDLIGDFIWCLQHGAIPVLPTRSGSAENGFLREDRLREFSLAAQRGQPLFGAFSSGSTAAPNFHLFDLSLAFGNAAAHGKSLGISERDILIQSLPVAHIFGLIAYLLTPALFGCEINFSTAPFDWTYPIPTSSARRVLHLIPDQLRAFERFVSSKEAIISVGAGIAPKLALDRLQKNGHKIHVTYGLTEAGPRAATGLWNDSQKEGWLGKFFPEVKPLLAEVEGSSLKLLKLHTPFRSLTVATDSAGYFETGDLVEQDGEDIVYRARLKNGFKYRGRLYTEFDFQLAKAKAGLDASAVFVRFSQPEEFRIYIPVLNNESLWADVFEELRLPHPVIRQMDQVSMDQMGKRNLSHALTSLKLERPITGASFI